MFLKSSHWSERQRDGSVTAEDIFKGLKSPSWTKPQATDGCKCIAAKLWILKVNLLPSISQFVEGVSGDDVSTDELHWWVALRRLLPEDGAGKHGVIPALLPQVDFNLEGQEWGLITCWVKLTIIKRRSVSQAARLYVSTRRCTAAVLSPA